MRKPAAFLIHGRSRALVVMAVPLIVVAVLGGDVAVSSLGRPAAARYVAVDPAFAAGAGWVRYEISAEMSPYRAWTNDPAALVVGGDQAAGPVNSGVPTQVLLEVVDYHSVLLAMAKMRSYGKARPGGGVWQAGAVMAPSLVREAAGGSSDPVGWETSCTRTLRVCGVYKFTMRYANVVVHVLVGSATAARDVPEDQALAYLTQITAQIRQRI